MLDWCDVGDWTWYRPRIGKRQSMVRNTVVRDDDPRLLGELILAGILEGA